MVSAALERHRGNHRIDSRAVLQARIDHGRALVDTPAKRRDDALDDAAHGAIAAEGHGMALQPALPLDKDFVVAVHHDFRDVRVGQQGLERPQADRLVDDLLPQRRPVDVRRHVLLRLGHQLDQQRVGLRAQRRIAHVHYIAAAQVDGFQQPCIHSAAPLDVLGAWRRRCLCAGGLRCWCSVTFRGGRQTHGRLAGPAVPIRCCRYSRPYAACAGTRA